MSIPSRIRRARPSILIPSLLALITDPGEGDPRAGKILLHTDLVAEHRRNGKLVKIRRLGSGVVTITWVNAMVSDAVTGSAVVPTLARYKYMETGIGTTAATDGDTGLQTAITSGPARVVATLSNAQSATTGNHAAKLQYAGTVSYSAGPTYPVAVTEWGLFDASTTGNMGDHRVFSAINVNNGDTITFTYSLTLPSNG